MLSLEASPWPIMAEWPLPALTPHCFLSQFNHWIIPRYDTGMQLAPVPKGRVRWGEWGSCRSRHLWWWEARDTRRTNAKSIWQKKRCHKRCCLLRLPPDPSWLNDRFRLFLSTASIHNSIIELYQGMILVCNWPPCRKEEWGEGSEEVVGPDTCDGRGCQNAKRCI